MDKEVYTIKIIMQSIFNSLGSNYSIKFITESLKGIVYAPQTNVTKLVEHLTETYTTSAVLNFYKGRDAIEACCRVLLPPGSQIITQAFTCYAIEEGIKRAGMVPVYADISEEGTNLTAESISAVFKKNPDAKAVLIQHSLGISADSVAIRKWCDTHGLLLIEDLAQGIGGVDTNGDILGRNADALIFSYGRDKIVDAISGGSVVFRALNPEQAERLADLKSEVEKTPFAFVYEDLVYPDTTSLIRKTHHLGLGKVVLLASKALGLLSNPIKSKTRKLTWMHPSFAGLAVLQFRNLEQQLLHRRKMAEKYFELLANSKVKPLATALDIQNSSNLRFSVRCDNFAQVEKLVRVLKKNRIYVSDRWYRSAVDCGNFGYKTAYVDGSCPNAELLSQQVLNLPTHREMTLKKVVKICKIILENS